MYLWLLIFSHRSNQSVHSCKYQVKNNEVWMNVSSSVLFSFPKLAPVLLSPWTFFITLLTAVKKNTTIPRILVFKYGTYYIVCVLINFQNCIYTVAVQFPIISLWMVLAFINLLLISNFHGLCIPNSSLLPCLKQCQTKDFLCANVLYHYSV